jgi:hypothetical protein
MNSKRITRREFEDMGEEDRRSYNVENYGIQTSHPVRKIPYVPNAVAGRPFKIRTVRR